MVPLTLIQAADSKGAGSVFDVAIVSSRSNSCKKHCFIGVEKMLLYYTRKMKKIDRCSQLFLKILYTVLISNLRHNSWSDASFFSFPYQCCLCIAFFEGTKPRESVSGS
ncbi:hypothetical protein ARALYDRAFT_915709 [Arabidopsis lyrata subsp. lyrata]|uniref:Uncharacterized protein n=1 Tax=Arabidopsis lyrata subsp. lyrata TaxID=81972 RepID=D7MHV9_ARALL|nr:hypothetical protein ARALYDRAFT_915709 [Arabidopsis lyrata subsp. lyrata]